MDARAAGNWKQAASLKRKTGTGFPKISYTNLFWLFMLGSVAGFVLEGLWCILMEGHWENHSATVWGPFCIIYGIGAAAVSLLSILLKGRVLPVRFLAFSAAGAAAEYFASLFQELCFGSVSWDYSGHFLNLGGRVSLKMSLIWGVLGIAFARLIFPLLTRLFAKMQGKGWRTASTVLTVFMAVDLAVTAAAVARWRSRITDGSPSDSKVIQFLDTAYDDETMSRLFPNMNFCRE